MSINVPAFLASLLIMLKGMIGIFAVIAIIYLSTVILNNVVKGN